MPRAVSLRPWNAEPVKNPAAPPWYRQPWPWFLIALPAAAVCASFYTLYLAVSAPEAVVHDDYDRNGLQVTRHLEQDAWALRHGMQAELRFTADGIAELSLQTPDAPPGSVTMQLIHPTAQGQDNVLVLTRNAEGRYTAPCPRPVGKRYLRLEATGDASRWRLRGVLEPGGEARARLLPGKA